MVHKLTQVTAPPPPPQVKLPYMHLVPILQACAQPFTYKSLYVLSGTPRNLSHSPPYPDFQPAT